MADRIHFSLKNYVAVIAVLISITMTVLDGTIVNVALPVLAEDFKVSEAQIIWIVTIYQLVVTMLLVPLSNRGELFSFKRIFLAGVVIFTAASAGCAMSPDLPVLLVSRAIQGIGAGCVMSVNIALIRLIYPKEVLARGLAFNAMVISISVAAGPTIAGALLSVASWHWLFLINIPFGVVAFLIGYRLLPQNPREDGERPRYDYVSAVGNALFFGLVFFASGNFSRKGDMWLTLTALLLGAIAGIFYFRRQQGHQRPMFPVDLFRIPVFTLSVCTSVCSFVAQNIALIALPFLFLNTCGFSTVATGLLMTPWPLATMIVAPLAARFVERHNPGYTAAAGMAVFMAGMVLMITMPVDIATPWHIGWRMAVCGVGFGIFQTPNNLVMVGCTPITRTGGASGMQSTARLTGQTLGATGATSVFALFSNISAVHVCLIISIIFAMGAGVFSITRGGKLKSA